MFDIFKRGLSVNAPMTILSLDTAAWENRQENDRKKKREASDLFVQANRFYQRSQVFIRRNAVRTN